MIDHFVTGGGGLRLHVREDGNPHGRPVVLIHSYSQSSLSWRRQLDAHDLSGPLRLLAMDLRGHGLSDKPSGVYGDSTLWAADVQAVLIELHLNHPVLVGWSYGALVICDYLRAHGDGALGGLNFVGALTTLGTPDADDVIGAEFLALVPALTSTDVTTAVGAIRALVPLVFAVPPPVDEQFLALGFNIAVPPFVRAQLLARVLDNRDVLQAVRVPTLLTQGEKDRIVAPAGSERLAALVPGAELSVYPGVGHAPFLEDPDRFGRELRKLVKGG